MISKQSQKNTSVKNSSNLKSDPGINTSKIQQYPSYTVFDLETTGVNTRSSEIIQIGALRVRNGHEVDSFCTYVRPVGVIPEAATRVNHITEATVADAQTHCRLVVVLR